jgi:hypothetical protein
MNCKPQISKDTYELMDTDAKLGTLYDMQVVTMECVAIIDTKLAKRTFLDKVSLIVGGIVGGILGALGLRGVTP